MFSLVCLSFHWSSLAFPMLSSVSYSFPSLVHYLPVLLSFSSFPCISTFFWSRSLFPVLPSLQAFSSLAQSSKPFPVLLSIVYYSLLFPIPIYFPSLLFISSILRHPFQSTLPLSGPLFYRGNPDGGKSAVGVDGGGANSAGA